MYVGGQVEVRGQPYASVGGQVDVGGHPSMCVGQGPYDIWHCAETAGWAAWGAAANACAWNPPPGCSQMVRTGHSTWKQCGSTMVGRKQGGWAMVGGMQGIQ
jgi:hypothetical protein